MDKKWMGLADLIAYGSEKEIIQNLVDAGCSPETIDCCISCLNNGKKEELLQPKGSFKKSPRKRKANRLS